MPRVRAMLLVPETASVASAAKSLTLGLNKLGPSDVTVPETFAIDPSFPPVPLDVPTSHPLARPRLMMTAPAPSAKVSDTPHVIRGTVDVADLEKLHDATKVNGTTRLFADPEIAQFTCGGDGPVGTAADVRRVLGVGRLQSLGFDGRNVAVAVVDNGVNLDFLLSAGLSPKLDAHLSWSPRRTVRPGQAPTDHGTMCAYDILISAPEATLLDYSVLQSTRRGGSQMAGILSDAVVAYANLLRMMRLPDDQRHFQSLVVSNSWGMFHPSWDFPPGNPGRYSDNPNHPFNVIVASLSAAGADILFAAGNCGPLCPDGRCQGVVENTITGANSHPDVITVAGVDTNDALVGYSSRGPGMLSPQKPDLAAYTHFLGSEVFGTGEPDSGTSAACPVMAGFVAAIRSVVPYSRQNPRRTPASLKQWIFGKLKNAPRGGWDPGLGRGIASGNALETAALDLA